MMSLQTYSVVDQMTSELASRRYQAARRRAAYLALARVILQGDERPALLATPGVPGPRCDWESASAA